MTYSVIVDERGQLVAWMDERPVEGDRPRPVIAPALPAHRLVQHVELEAPPPNDRRELVGALTQAVAKRGRS